MSNYTAPDTSYIRDQIDHLIKIFIEFTEDEYAGAVSAPTIDNSALKDCVLRVHQRGYYFKVFHEMPNGMSDVKGISLYCFWILKYRPFYFPFSTPKNRNGKDFLERFCLYLLARVLRRIYKKELPLSEEGIESLVYSLRHHDLTKEALTEIFELLEDVVNPRPRPRDEAHTVLAGS